MKTSHSGKTSTSKAQTRSNGASTFNPSASRRWRVVIPVAALLALCVSAPAQTYLIDFGGPNRTTRGPLPDDPLNYWNNVDNNLGGASNGVLANLVSSLNTTSSISLVIIRPFNGNNENGTQSGTVYPINATRDSLFGNTESFNGLTNIFPSIKLTGLDAATKYGFTFYASRTGVSDNRETGYTLTGASSAFAALDPVNNLDTTVSVTNLIPDGAGEIRIDIAPTANNDNGNHFTYLGVLQVDAIPPQTPLAFTQQPVSQKVIQLKPVTFTAAVTGSPPYFVQWYENSSPLPEANQFSYTIPVVQLGMNAYTYSVSVSNLSYGVTSTNAVLTVLSDTNPPTVLKAASYDGNSIELTFNEALDPGTAGDIANYSVNNGAVGVGSVTLGFDSKTVFLLVNSTLSGSFSVKINNVQDAAGNSIAPNTSITGSVVPIEEQPLLFDFGGNNLTQYGPNPGDDPVNYWNNVSGGIGTSDVGILPTLVTVHNAQTPGTLEMISRFNSDNGNGSTVATVFPTQATRDSLFGNTELFGALSNIFPRFKLTGLNPVRQYNLTFYASRTGVGDNRNTLYTIAGASTNAVALNPANNINNTVTAQAITPSSGGEITISLSPGPGNNNGNHFTYLGVLRLAPYVPPLQFLAPTIQGGKIRLEWTGTGQLLRAPSVLGTWNPVLPTPVSPFLDDLVPGENRFYRLQQ